MDVDKGINGLEFIRGLDGLQLLGVFFVILMGVGITVFFVLLKKGYLKLNTKKEIEEEEEPKPSMKDPNVRFFQTRLWMKNRVLKRHLGWILDAYPKKATEEDREKLKKILRFAELESMEYTDYIIEKNQFGKMSPGEFEKYLHKIPMDIVMHVSRNITSFYEEMPFTVSRDEMLENTGPLIPKCVEDLAEMFVSFRAMEIQAEKEIEERRYS